MIRLLSVADAPAYQQIRLLSLQTNPQAFLSSYEKESQYPSLYFANKISYATKAPIFGIYGWFTNKLSRSGRLPDSSGVEKNPHLIATCQLAAEYHPKNQHLANIFELYVHPDYRQKNIASKLLNHLINKAKSFPSLEQLHLRVNSKNQTAINLYKKLGFKHIATRKKAVKESDNTYQDELLFCLNL